MAETIQDGSLCGLGKTAPNPVLATIRYFRSEYEAHIRHRKCPAGVCKDLIVYAIDRKKCTGCGACLRTCPSGAVSGAKKKAHGSTVRPDGWIGYDRATLTKAGFIHKARVLKGSGKKPHGSLPRVHLVVSLLKRWLLGTHQGAFGLFHLDYYLDEFTFRFNRRKSRSRGKLFYRLMQQAVSVDPVPYARITKRSKPFRPPGPTH